LPKNESKLKFKIIKIISTRSRRPNIKKLCTYFRPKLRLIRDSHRMHHEFNMSRIYSLLNNAWLRTEQHILRGWTIEVNINGAVNHVLDRIWIRVGLLWKCLENFITLFVLKFLAIFIYHKEVCSSIQISLDCIPNCNCNFRRWMER